MRRAGQRLRKVKLNDLSRLSFKPSQVPKLRKVPGAADSPTHAMEPLQNQTAAEPLPHPPPYTPQVAFLCTSLWLSIGTGSTHCRRVQPSKQNLLEAQQRPGVSLWLVRSAQRGRCQHEPSICTLVQSPLEQAVQQSQRELLKDSFSSCPRRQLLAGSFYATPGGRPCFPHAKRFAHFSFLQSNGQPKALSAKC